MEQAMSEDRDSLYVVKANLIKECKTIMLIAIQ